MTSSSFKMRISRPFNEAIPSRYFRLNPVMPSGGVSMVETAIATNSRALSTRRPDHASSDIDDHQPRSKIEGAPLKSEAQSKVDRGDDSSAHMDNTRHNRDGIRHGSNLVNHLDLLNKAASHAIGSSCNFEKNKGLGTNGFLHD
jgi:hypothetical protein